MNIKLDNISVVNVEQHPQLLSLKSIFIRGSVIRYVHMDPNDVNTDLLQDATRREFLKQQQQQAPSKPSTAASSS